MASQAEQVFNIAWRFRGNVAPQLDRMAKSATHTQQVMDSAGRSFQQADRQMGKLQGTMQSTISQLERLSSATQRYAQNAHKAYDASTALVGAFGGAHARRANELLHKYNAKTSLGYLAVTKSINKQYRPAFDKLMKGYDLFNKSQDKLNTLLDKADDAFATLNESLTRGTSKTLGLLQERWDKFVSSVTESGDLAASFKFGDTLIEAQKQVKLTGKDLENLRDIANQLGVEVGKNREVFVGALAPLVKYGIKGKEMLLSVGKAAGELNVTSGIAIEETAMAFAKLSKTMDDLSPKDVQALTHSIAVLGQEGGASVEQLISQLEELGPYLMQIPKAAQKEAIASFSAISAALEREMIPGQEISALFQNIVTINDDAIKSSADLAGAIGNLTGQSFNLVNAYGKMRKGRPDELMMELAKAVGNLNVQYDPEKQRLLGRLIELFGGNRDAIVKLGDAYREGRLDIEGMRKIFVEAGKDGKAFTDILNMQNGTVDRLRENVQEATGVLKAQFTDVLETLTRPALVAVSTALKEFVGWMQAGSHEMRKFNTLLFVALGGAAVGTVLAMVGAAAALTVGIGALNSAMALLGTTMTGRKVLWSIAEIASKNEILAANMSFATGEVLGMESSFLKLDKGVVKATLSLLKANAGLITMTALMAPLNVAVKGLNIVGIGKDWKMAGETITETGRRWSAADSLFGKASKRMGDAWAFMGKKTKGAREMTKSYLREVYSFGPKAFGKLLSPLKKIPDLAKSAGTAILPFIMNPVGAIIAAGVAFTAFLVLLGVFPEKVQKAIAGALDWFGDFLVSIPDYIDKGLGLVINGVEGVFDYLYKWLSGQDLSGAAEGPFGTLAKAVIQFMGKLLLTVGKLVWLFAVKLPYKISKALIMGALKILVGFGGMLARAINWIFGGFMSTPIQKDLDKSDSALDTFRKRSERKHQAFADSTVARHKKMMDDLASETKKGVKKVRKNYEDVNPDEPIIKSPLTAFTDVAKAGAKWLGGKILTTDVSMRLQEDHAKKLKDIAGQQSDLDIEAAHRRLRHKDMTEAEYNKRKAGITDQITAENAFYTETMKRHGIEVGITDEAGKQVELTKDLKDLTRDMNGEEERRLAAQRAWVGRTTYDVRKLFAERAGRRGGALSGTMTSKNLGAAGSAAAGAKGAAWTQEARDYNKYQSMLSPDERYGAQAAANSYISRKSAFVGPPAPPRTTPNLESLAAVNLGAGQGDTAKQLSMLLQANQTTNSLLRDIRGATVQTAASNDEMADADKRDQAAKLAQTFGKKVGSAYAHASGLPTSKR